MYRHVYLRRHAAKHRRPPFVGGHLQAEMFVPILDVLGNVCVEIIGDRIWQDIGETCLISVEESVVW